MATRELEVGGAARRTGCPCWTWSATSTRTPRRRCRRAWDAAAADAQRGVLDFSRTSYINSTGIALIVQLLANARARGIALTARGLSEHYRTIFEITRLADFMRIADA